MKLFDGGALLIGIAVTGLLLSLKPEVKRLTEEPKYLTVQQLSETVAIHCYLTAKELAAGVQCMKVGE